MEETHESLGRSFPPSILLQIFDKLPFDCMLRCKLVCKQWHCVVSDRVFQSNYNSKIIGRPLTLILLPHPDSSSYPPTPPLSYQIDRSYKTDSLTGQPWALPCNLDPPRVTVMGSYNGLIALYQPPNNFCLFNPCTKEEKLVRVPAGRVFGRIELGVTGLSHDPACDEYKLVITSDTICRHGNNAFLLVSFKDGRMYLESMKPSKLIKDHLVTSSGTTPLVNWLGTTAYGAPYWLNWNTESLIRFDGNKEEFGMVELPESFKWRTMYVPGQGWGLGAQDGKLVVAFNNGIWVTDVWALEEPGAEDPWRFLFSMVLDRLSNFRILSWRKDDLWVSLYDENTDELVIYCHREPPRRMWLKGRGLIHPNKVASYVPTLVSPID